MITILDVLTDERILGRHFSRHTEFGDTWVAWKTFFRALYGLPLEGEDFDRFTKHTGRTLAPSRPFREAYCLAGRRGGKSSSVAVVGVFHASFADYSKYLQVGERPLVMLLAADRTQARNILDYIQGFYEEVPVLRAMVVGKRKEGLDLSNRVRIEVRTSDYRKIRGSTLAAVIADELAFWQSESTVNPAGEVLAAARPGLATIPNSLLIGISSAYSKRGYFYETYKKQFGRDDSRILFWKAASVEMNPSLDRGDIEEAYAEDPSRARSEWGAEFREDLESMFSRETLESLVVPGRMELPPREGIKYFAFVDPSGGRVDSYAWAIVHKEGDKAVVDLVGEERAPFSPEAVTDRISREELRRYRIKTVYGDNYAGNWPADRFVKNGISYEVSGLNRSELYLGFLPRVMSGSVELLDNQRVILQLANLERRTGRTGKDAVDHFPGQHDDVANALAGAVVAALPASPRELDLGLTNAINAGLENPGSELWKIFVKGQTGVSAENADSTEIIMKRGPGDQCPECGGTGCISRRGPLFHCGPCGAEWRADPPPPPPQGQRGTYGPRGRS